MVSGRTRELIAVRRRFELGRYDLVRWHVECGVLVTSLTLRVNNIHYLTACADMQVTTLNQLETKKRFALVERVVCALYAHLGFFHQARLH